MKNFTFNLQNAIKILENQNCGIEAWEMTLSATLAHAPKDLKKILLQAAEQALCNFFPEITPLHYRNAECNPKRLQQLKRELGLGEEQLLAIIESKRALDHTLHPAEKDAQIN